MGKGSKFETGDRFRQTRGHKGRNQYGYPGEVVGEIEGLLGGEEKNQKEVINFRKQAALTARGHRCVIR